MTNRSLPCAMLILVAACSKGFGEGDELVCFSPSVPTVVMELLARTDDPLIAVDFDTMAPAMWEEEAGVWRSLSAPRGGPMWTVGLDGAYMTLQYDALSRSMDGDSWDTIGAGIGPQANGNGSLLQGPTSDGSYWAALNGGETYPLQRLLPGAETWTPAFADQVTWAERGGMGADGTAWVVARSAVDGSLQGLYRLAPDGSALELILGCDSAALSFCEASVAAIAFNADGDLFYYMRNDLVGVHRFFEIAAGTDFAVERGGLPDEVMYATSLAAVGKTLYLTGRDSYEGGEGFLLGLPVGVGVAEVITMTQDSNAEVVVSTDGTHVYTHSPGVCELR